MIRLRLTVEHDRFFARRLNQSNSSDPVVWQALKQIEHRLLDLKEEVEYFMAFNPEERMHELQAMHEQLIAIKSNKFNEPSLEAYAFDTF